MAARAPNGKLVYRCPAEPVDAYVAKGGAAADAVGRRCLCNGLMASVGYAQTRAADEEQPLITSGDELLRISEFLGDRRSYTARDVIAYLLS